MERKRLDYLDMAKGIGMVLVLMGHLQGEQIFELSPYIHPWCVFIFSFHMPMFFIISGILISIKNDEAKPLSEIAKKRFSGIMVPYFWFSLFYLSVVVYSLIKGGIKVQTLLVQIWYVVSGYGMNVLWFLPALYLGELLFLYLRRKFASEKVFISVISITAAIGFVLSYLLTLPQYDTAVLERVHEFATVLLRPILVSFFIAVGYYAHKLSVVNNKFGNFFSRPAVNPDGKIKGTYRVYYILTGFLGLLICALFSVVNNGIDFRTLVFRNIFFFLLCALAGSFGLIIMCKGLPRIGLFCFWGVGSLIFMGTHNSETILYLAMKTAMYANKYLTRARGYICYAIIVGIILIFSSVMIIVISKCFPFVMGKPFKKKRKQIDS